MHSLGDFDFFWSVLCTAHMAIQFCHIGFMASSKTQMARLARFSNHQDINSKQISDTQAMFEELLFSSSRYLIESFELHLFLKQPKFSAANRIITSGEEEAEEADELSGP